MEKKMSMEENVEEKILAEEKHQEEISPLIDFSKTEEEPDDFNQKSETVKKYFREQLIGKISQLLFGIFCIIMTVHMGVIGSVFFIAAIFYLIPDGFIKTIVFSYRLLHHTDFVTAKDYHVDNHYLQIVVQKFRKFPLTAKEKENE